MSKIANISFASNIQKYGNLLVLKNSFFKNKLNYHTCNGKTINGIAVTSVARNFSNGVVTSPFPSATIPNENIVEHVWKNTEEWNELPVATCGVSGRSYTYEMMKMLIDRFAQSLLSHCCLKPGEVIALLLPNIPEYIIVSHGAMLAGLAVTLGHPLHTPDELTRQFQNSDVKAIVTIPLFLDMALKISSELPGYRTTICAGGDDDAAKNVQGLQNMMMAGHESDLPAINPQDVALLPYSSGTTGLPKGVKLTHLNLVANLAQTENEDLSHIQPEDKNQKGLTVLPMFHIYGFNGVLHTSIKMGIPLITLPKFTPEDYIKALVEHRPHFLFVVPSLMLFLASHPAVTKEHLSSVNVVATGGASATEGLMQKFREKIGKCVIIRQGYGMTETSPVLLLTPFSTPSQKKGTVGVLLPNTEAKVVSSTSNEALGPNQTGELLVRGPQVMTGYLNNEKATKETITEDGWLRTGDVVYYDDDKYFYIVDRCKELIKVKGNQVSPTELENIILEIPGVSDVAVVGIPDTVAGELPRAYVVRKEGAKLTDEDIFAHVHPKVAPYKKLGGGVKFIEIIPRNVSGKVLRNELKIVQC